MNPTSIFNSFSFILMAIFSLLLVGCYGDLVSETHIGIAGEPPCDLVRWQDLGIKSNIFVVYSSDLGGSAAQVIRVIENSEQTRYSDEVAMGPLHYYLEWHSDGLKMKDQGANPTNLTKRGLSNVNPIAFCKRSSGSFLVLQKSNPHNPTLSNWGVGLLELSKSFLGLGGQKLSFQAGYAFPFAKTAKIVSKISGLELSSEGDITRQVIQYEDKASAMKFIRSGLSFQKTMLLEDIHPVSSCTEYVQKVHEVMSINKYHDPNQKSWPVSWSQGEPDCSKENW